MNKTKNPELRNLLNETVNCLPIMVQLVYEQGVTVSTKILHNGLVGVSRVLVLEAEKYDEFLIKHSKYPRKLKREVVGYARSALSTATYLIKKFEKDLIEGCSSPDSLRASSSQGASSSHS